jgi:flavoprotein
MNRKDKLVDLEYMLPTEHKEERLEEKAKEALKEACYYCNRTSDETPLIPVFHQGEDQWSCPRCLRKLDDDHSYYPTSGFSQGYNQTPRNQDESTSPMTTLFG